MNNFDYNDIDFNNMGAWPIFGKSAIIFIILASVFGISYYFFLSEQSDALLFIEKKEILLKQEFERKQRKAVNLLAYKKQMKAIKGSFQTLLQQLPKADQMAELLDEVSYAATGAGCEILSLGFDDEIDAEFYSEKPINIQVSGTYHQIADFVSRVSRLPRIVTLHDFIIQLKDKKSLTESLVMQVMAKTYRSDSGES
jgi:type IV pilus assembly protein PilO